MREASESEMATDTDSHASFFYMLDCESSNANNPSQSFYEKDNFRTNHIDASNSIQPHVCSNNQRAAQGTSRVSKDL